jgi:low temperature requirement protein LtrA
MARRKLIQAPTVRDDELRGAHRPVTWLELFFDLFIVVVLARIAHDLAGAHFAPGALLAFAGAFIPLFWLWVGAAYYIERFETGGLEFRLTMFGFMAAVSGLGALSNHAMTDHFAGYAGAYAAGRIFTALLWLNAARHNTALIARACWRLATGTLVGAALIIAAVLVEGPARWALYALGLACDIVAPRLNASVQAAFPPVSTSKYPERFGLFTIIALGECAAGLIGGLGDAKLPAWNLGVFCLFATFALWWIYFDFVGRRKFRQSAAAILAWVYSHLGLFAAIAIAGAAMRELLAGHHGAENVLAFACAGFLFTTAFLELLLHRADDEPTHWLASPALKGATAAVMAIAGLFLHGLMVYIFTALGLLLPMLYGLWVWHTVEAASESPTH